MLSKFKQLLTEQSYRLYARLAAWRWKGESRCYWGARELDRLYEVEDFLRNIGETSRADYVAASRRMLKLTASEYNDLVDAINEQRQ